MKITRKDVKILGFLNMNLFLKIIYFGTSQNAKHSVSRPIIASNIISIILCCCTLVMFLIRNLYFDKNSYGINTTDLLTLIAAFSIPLLLNKINFTLLSRLVACIIPAFMCLAIFISHMKKIPVVETSYYDGCRILLLSFSTIPFLLFDKKISLCFY